MVVTYPGAILRPSRVEAREGQGRYCPGCGWGPAGRGDRYACSPTAYHYRCQRCMDPETARFTTWKDS